MRYAPLDFTLAHTVGILTKQEWNGRIKAKIGKIPGSLLSVNMTIVAHDAKFWPEIEFVKK